MQPAAGMTEREKMVAGANYNAHDPELVALREKCRDILRAFNATPETSEEERKRLLSSLLGREATAWIQPPFYCDYGWNITFGAKVYFNFNCVILDVAPVTIGDNTMFGPAVQIYTATHPLDAAERRSGIESGKPIKIGSDVWVGGGAIICPGVTIGDRAVIGAGSVVTRDIPDDALAVGNPARVLRIIAKNSTLNPTK